MLMSKQSKKFPLHIDKENLFKGFMYAMLLSATLHLLGCMYQAAATNNPDYVNMFNILGISLFVPELGHGALNNLLGILTVIIIGAGFYFMQEQHDKHPNSRRAQNQ